MSLRIGMKVLIFSIDLRDFAMDLLATDSQTKFMIVTNCCRQTLIEPAFSISHLLSSSPTLIRLAAGTSGCSKHTPRQYSSVRIPQPGICAQDFYPSIFSVRVFEEQAQKGSVLLCKRIGSRHSLDQGAYFLRKK